MAEGESVSSVWLKGEHCTDPPIQNAIPLLVIERDLLLRHKKSERGEERGRESLLKVMGAKF